MKNIVSLLLLVFIGACSENIVDFESNEVRGFVSNNALIVINKLDRSIYYFVIERETASLVLWVPISTKRNKIAPSSSGKIAFNDIHGYDRGEEILLYYWANKEPKGEDIKNMVIDTRFLN